MGVLWLLLQLSVATGEEHGGVTNITPEQYEIMQLVKCRMQNLGLPLDDYCSGECTVDYRALVCHRTTIAVVSALLITDHWFAIGRLLQW